MNTDEASTVLAKASAYDGRKPSRAMALAWAEALADVRVDDALVAVARHYATSTDWAMPAHIRRAADEVRRLRQAEEAFRASEARGVAGPTPEPHGPPGEAAAQVLADLRARLPEGKPLRRWLRDAASGESRERPRRS